MTSPVRHAVKVVLLNDADELLLMCMDDPSIRSVGEGYPGHFWTLIGGAVEEDETVREAAEREVFEETGLSSEDVEFGRHIWYGELDLILYDKETRIKQDFLVARTKKKGVSLNNLTTYEKAVVKQVSWFSFDAIVNSGETIHPVVMRKYLPDVIAGKYPKEPIAIDLSAGAEV